MKFSKEEIQKSYANARMDGPSTPSKALFSSSKRTVLPHPELEKIVPEAYDTGESVIEPLGRNSGVYHPLSKNVSVSSTKAYTKKGKEIAGHEFLGHNVADITGLERGAGYIDELENALKARTPFGNPFAVERAWKNDPGEYMAELTAKRLSIPQAERIETFPFGTEYSKRTVGVDPADVKKLSEEDIERIVRENSAVQSVPPGFAEEGTMRMLGGLRESKTPYNVVESEPWASVKGRYERDIAKQFEDAQRHAALPVEEGGLGLRKNNTAAERAEAMGYTQKAYHGTTGNVTEFSKERRGAETGATSARMADFYSSSPTVASGYAVMGRPRTEALFMHARARAEKEGNTALMKYLDDEFDKWFKSGKQSFVFDDPLQLLPEGANVMPVLVNTEGLLPRNYHGKGYEEYSYSKLLKEADEQGLSGATFLNTDDAIHVHFPGVSDVYGVMDQSKVRSVNAAFDPFKRNEAGLMKAEGGPVGVNDLTNKYKING